MAQYDVADRSAIVTGGASGIGRAVALLLAANGASVIVADVRPELAESVVNEISAVGGTAEVLAGDVSDPEFAQGAVEAAEKLAPLKVAINNAGIGSEAATIGDHSLEGWRTIIDINLNAVFYGLRAQLPAMAKNGGGSIVNMASVLGSVGTPMSSAYVAAKHALLGLTKNAALEYGNANVRTNAVGPGYITTALVESNFDANGQAALAAKHALGRLGTPEEVAGLVAFLASDAASFISGSYHPVDGGYTAQ